MNHLRKEKHTMQITRSTIITYFLSIALISAIWAQPTSAKQPGGEIYISDMSKCLPNSAISEKLEQGKWRLLDYESTGPKGKMLMAGSFINAPQVTLPLGVKGWHAVYVGLWNPNFAYDGEAAVKLKLSGEKGFRRIKVDTHPNVHHQTLLNEVYLRSDDLTGRDLVIGKNNGPLGKAAYIAYIKLVPLTEEQSKTIQADRKQTATRNLVATIDGSSFFHGGEFRQPEHFLDLAGLYRHSDVAKVLWACCYGATTNYPSSVKGTDFIGRDSRARFVSDGGANAYMRGERQNYKTLRDMAGRKIIPQNVVADHVHKMGIKFDLMFRLGILGGCTLRVPEDNFVRRNPHLRQVRSDGLVVDKASYAFDEVQNLMLSMIGEATRKIDTDGINLCFVRGPHFLRYEKPILDAFRAKHGGDARKVDPGDPRLLQTRAEFMTRFIHKTRKVLDDVGKEKGKRLSLSVWVWPSTQSVWLGGKPMDEGLDVKGWISDGLLDSVICQEGIDPEYIKLGKKTGCKFVLFTGYRGAKAMSPTSLTQAYQSGVEMIAKWDIDAEQDIPSRWNWMRRTGHREEMADWAKHDPGQRAVKLMKIEGVDVANGLVDAVFSGG